LGVVGKTVSKLQLRRFISSPPLDILAYDGHYTPVYNLLSRTQPCDLERRRL
jgi:homogentisate 1,2-dioxygenase